MTLHIIIMMICYVNFVGFINNYGIQELLNESAKMKDFDNLHVMTLKGVCLDGGPVPYIVLPFMANGSLLTYLRKQRSNLVLKKNADGENEMELKVHVVNSYCCMLLLWSCHCCYITGTEASHGHVSTGGQRHGVPCQQEGDSQRSGSKKLHVR